jgi:hypothetical protein
MFKVVIRLLVIMIVAITGGTAMGDEAVEVFSKMMPDGRGSTVVKTTRHIIHAPTEDDQKRLPDGFVAVGGELRIDHYVLSIRDKKGNEVIAWQKEVKSLVIPSGEALSDEIIVHDIVAKEDQIAILFTMLSTSTDVEIVGVSDRNGYEIRLQRSLSPQSSLSTISAGRLSWLDDLYILLASSPVGTEIWRVGGDNVVKIFQDR